MDLGMVEKGMKDLHPFMKLGSLEVYVFPIILLIAVFCCILVYLYSDKYDNFYFHQIKASSLYCMIGAGLGGKLLYIFTRSNSTYLTLFDRVGGFVFFGGFIGAVTGLYVYSKRKWDRFFDLLDIYTSMLPLGQAIGRIGCYFNGCCYGKYYTGILSVKYIVDGKETQVFPAWFIESFFCFMLFICMFGISKKIHSGVYSSIYMMSYSLFRFSIEFFRGDRIRGVWCGLSTSQYIAIAVFSMGYVILIKSAQIKETNLLIKGRNEI